MAQSSPSNQSLDRAFRILSLFGPGQPCLGLSEISRLAGLSKATAHRLLTTMEQYGLLARNSVGDATDRRYRLGLKLLELGRIVSDGLEVRRVALPFMRLLRNEVGESVNLVVVDGLDGVYVEQVEGTQPVRLYIQVGRRAPLFAGASTRLLLAHLPPDDVEKILTQRPPRAYTPGTITDVPAILELLARARRDGYTVSRGELQPGTVEVAVPLLNYSGDVVAALSLAGPENRFGQEDVNRLLGPLQRCAADISAAMGYRQSSSRGDGQ